MTGQAAVAVFDLGKTNSKLFVLGHDGSILWDARSKPSWVDHDGIRVLDDQALFAWMKDVLKTAVEDHGARHVTFSGHGCTFALTKGDSLVHPILDYEQEPPREVTDRIDMLVPTFSETYSPRLPLGFNYGRHILWVEATRPGLLAQADAILSYPQFWSWTFSGRKVSEVSYIGCHSHLWAPLIGDFSSLVDNRGWREKMPAFAKAGDELGTFPVETKSGEAVPVAVHNGVHDSNAALYFYRSVGFDDFTLVSTGTWVVIFNSTCPLEALDEHRDMLANVTVDGRPAPTIRFMGGREYEIASGGWNKPVSLEALLRVIAKGAFALPSFAPGGPMQGFDGRFVGPVVGGEERAAAALLYVVLMTDLSLDLIRSSNPIVIDGGLVKTGLFAQLLAQLRPAQPIFTSTTAEGSAFGAAALVFDELGQHPFANETVEAASLGVEGLDAYRRGWSGFLEIKDASAMQPEKELHA
ncbi:MULTISPECIES: FGGY-family carbohydrate kinase [Rhizobium]|uniref:Carbohydrate kinase n=1 Tax=Rhizobium favelukesii TaxID=348824 RepID=W6RLQ0_9HYPH|nr:MULTISPECIES: carbohydrate kinase [Rhizobium]MCA0804604.1 carbohydrate kinase [Rhizobium sp. T1473]MCS0462083.1 carbohydrate kinase [Rhizobium favelukesii]UFS80012.1 carbohydrate kinase [Rhizobium sp. T136]CDM61744.1 carbohydrate kinase [Rhizobium favelukesii]